MFNLNDFLRDYLDGGKNEVKQEDNGLSVLNTDSFDKRTFENLLEVSNELKQLSTNDSFPFFKELLGDIWASFYKLTPKLLPKDEIKKELLGNHHFINKVMNDDFYASHKQHTELDKMMSILGTMEMGEKTINWVQEQLEHNQKIQELLQQMQQVGQQIQKQQEQNQQNKGEDSQQQGNDPLTDQMNDLLQQFANLMQESLDQNGNSLLKAFSKAMDNAKETNENLENLLGGSVAGKGESDLQKVPLRDKVRIAEMIRKNRKLKNIADWAGRFKKIAKSKHKTIATEGVGRGGITFGNDLANVLPSEIFQYFDERTKKDFIKRFE